MHQHDTVGSQKTVQRSVYATKGSIVQIGVMQTFPLPIQTQQLEVVYLCIEQTHILLKTFNTTLRALSS